MGSDGVVSDLGADPQAPDTTQLAISAAVAIADAPFAELENQSRNLAAMAACGVLAKQDAVDVAHCAALAAFGPGMVQRHGADTIQEIISIGFEAPLVPQLRTTRAYETPESVEAAFWYVASLNDAERLARWLREHPQDAPHLAKLLEAKCRAQSS